MVSVMRLMGVLGMTSGCSTAHPGNVALSGSAARRVSAP